MCVCERGGGSGRTCRCVGGGGGGGGQDLLVVCMGGRSVCVCEEGLEGWTEAVQDLHVCGGGGGEGLEGWTEKEGGLGWGICYPGALWCPREGEGPYR